MQLITVIAYKMIPKCTHIYVEIYSLPEEKYDRRGKLKNFSWPESVKNFAAKCSINNKM